MRIRLLGTAAGGGFPQWNCNCDNCRIARRDPGRAVPRTQSCVAVSGDGVGWFLINASPDIRSQIESFPPLWPAADRRGTGIAGVLLTNGDLDHTLGLFNLREGSRLWVHATASVRRALAESLGMTDVFSSYCGIDWTEPATRLSPLDGALRYAAFPVPGKPPRYRSAAAPSTGDAVGYRFVDDSTGGRLVVIPDLGGWTDKVAAHAADADVLLLDGTFFTADEMRTAGVGAATAADMGHVPVGGDDGTLARIADWSDVERIYVHINNTNPMLLKDSPQRADVQAAGVQVGFDGMELEL